MDQHGQTAQKLKPVKNVQNCSKMISANWKQKSCFATKTSPKVSRNASTYSNFARKQAIRPNNTKTKNRSKGRKHWKQKCVKTLLIIQILLTNDQNDQTKQEMKRG